MDSKLKRNHLINVIKRKQNLKFTSLGPSMTTLKYRGLCSSTVAAMPGTGSCCNRALS